MHVPLSLYKIILFVEKFYYEPVYTSTHVPLSLYKVIPSILLIISPIMKARTLRKSHVDYNTTKWYMSGNMYMVHNIILHVWSMISGLSYLAREISNKYPKIFYTFLFYTYKLDLCLQIFFYLPIFMIILKEDGSSCACEWGVLIANHCHHIPPSFILIITICN